MTWWPGMTEQPGRRRSPLDLVDLGVADAASGDAEEDFPFTGDGEREIAAFERLAALPGVEDSGDEHGFHGCLPSRAGSGMVPDRPAASLD